MCVSQCFPKSTAGKEGKAQKQRIINSKNFAASHDPLRGIRIQSKKNNFFKLINMSILSYALTKALNVPSYSFKCYIMRSFVKFVINLK